MQAQYRCARPGRAAQLGQRIAGLTAGTFLLCIFLGCMSFTIGGSTIPSTVVANEEGTRRQEGRVALHGRSEVDVYYYMPFASTPNLTVDGSEVTIVDQKPDHFRIKNAGSSREFTWTARGMVPASTPAAATTTHATITSTAAAPAPAPSTATVAIPPDVPAPAAIAPPQPLPIEPVPAARLGTNISVVPAQAATGPENPSQD